MSLGEIEKKFLAFGWNTLRIDGHDFDQILNALAKARAEKTKPTMIIADTVKGKGVSFMENVNKWHGTSPNAEELKKALSEFDSYEKTI
jgi:transketolase